MSQPFGAYLQCHKQPLATYKCLESFRNNYPDSTVILLSDNGYDYSEMANFFGCIYIHENENIWLTVIKHLIKIGVYNIKRILYIIV
jgi:hypothetical protein